MLDIQGFLLSKSKERFAPFFLTFPSSLLSATAEDITLGMRSLQTVVTNGFFVHSRKSITTLYYIFRKPLLSNVLCATLKRLDRKIVLQSFKRFF